MPALSVWLFRIGSACLQAAISAQYRSANFLAFANWVATIACPLSPLSTSVGVPFGFAAADAAVAGSTSSAAITTIERRAVLANLLTESPLDCHRRACERRRRGRFVESYI